jgi:uncharacterized membrane protein YhaH (DUF805 family)
MADWKPAGEVEGVFERRSIEEPVAAPVAPSPYTPPAEGETMDELAQQTSWPGARRRSFLLMTLGLPLLCNVAAAFASPLLISQLGPEITVMASVGLAVFLFCAVIFVSLQRLVNVGMSRWWYLGNLVPVLNLWVGYRMFACPAGYAHHKKLDGVGVALAIVYWLMLAIALIVILATLALVFGVAGNAEIQQQFEKAIQQALQAGSTS